MGYLYGGAPQKDIETVEKMKKYGGSFIQALAVCFELADRINYGTLKHTFQGYWDTYEQGFEKEDSTEEIEDEAEEAYWPSPQEVYPEDYPSRKL